MLRCRHRVVLFPLMLIAAIAAPAFGQNPRAEIRPSTNHDVSPPLRDLPPGPRVYGILEAEPVRRVPSSRNPSFGPDPLLRAPSAAPAVLAPSTLVNFNGIGQGFSGPAGTFTVNSAPPDTNAAVGPNHIVETVNTDLAVFSKAGTAIFGPVPSIRCGPVSAVAARPAMTATRSCPTIASLTAGSFRSSRCRRSRSSSASRCRKARIRPAPTTATFSPTPTGSPITRRWVCGPTRTTSPTTCSTMPARRFSAPRSARSTAPRC